MSALESRIKLELWSPLPLGTGTLLMDITGLATTRQINKTRNDADEVNFTLDLREFERLALAMNQPPGNLLQVNFTEVRASSRGVYIAGGQVNYVNVVLDATREVLEVKAYGFLNIMSSRYTDYDEVYTTTEISSIVTTQLAYTQGLTNGNLGIVLGNIATIGAITWEFHQQDIKSGWQDLASLQVGGFDLEITADKKLNIYTVQGAYRNDISLEYGANIKTATIPIDGTQSTNEIIALGAGIGSAATVQLPIIVGQTQMLPTSPNAVTNPNGVISADNAAAQVNTTLLQSLQTYNGINDPNTLLKAAQSTLAVTALPIVVAQIEVALNGPYISDLSIGDFIPLNMSAHPYLSGMNAYYRLEKYEAAIDDEDNVFATLYLS